MDDLWREGGGRKEEGGGRREGRKDARKLLHIFFHRGEKERGGREGERGERGREGEKGERRGGRQEAEGGGRGRGRGRGGEGRERERGGKGGRGRRREGESGQRVQSEERVRGEGAEEGTERETIDLTSSGSVQKQARIVTAIFWKGFVLHPSGI